jgi:hypothetical protein
MVGSMSLGKEMMNDDSEMQNKWGKIIKMGLCLVMWKMNRWGEGK